MSAQKSGGVADLVSLEAHMSLVRKDVKTLKAALADFSKLPHVEFDHWTTDCIASMVDQAEAQIDLVQENDDPDFVRKPGDVKQLRAFVRKWKAEAGR